MYLSKIFLFVEKLGIFGCAFNDTFIYNAFMHSLLPLLKTSCHLLNCTALGLCNNGIVSYDAFAVATMTPRTVL